MLPWIHAASLTDGSTQLCCVAEKTSGVNLNKSTVQDYWNGDYIKDVRNKMLQGNKIAACRRCYEEESNGYRSHRLIENKAWHDKLGFDFIDSLVKQTGQDGQLNAEVLSLDLRLGNTCNLQCVMCQPRESSKWASLSEKVINEVTDSELKSEWKYKRDIKIESYEWYKNAEFWANLKKILPFIREIIIAGGEPMIIKQHLNFLKECAMSGEAKHIHVRYHTNLMEFPVDMIPYWEKFERVEFFASADGMGDIAHYIRHPTKWEVIEKNLQIIDNMPDNTWLRFLYSVQALNVHHLPDFIRWVRSKNFKKQNAFTNTQSFVHPGLVHWPEYLNPKILPNEIKKKVTESFEKLKLELNEPFDKYDGIVSFMNSESFESKSAAFKDYCRTLDVVRGTDRFKVFPELREMF
ncbi:MAG: radical SAM protein [Bdellovibrio sp.]|nr:radical SAM protein [Bdellovibrio sp.]